MFFLLNKNSEFLFLKNAKSAKDILQDLQCWLKEVSQDTPHEVGFLQSKMHTFQT